VSGTGVASAVADGRLSFSAAQKHAHKEDNIIISTVGKR